VSGDFVAGRAVVYAGCGQIEYVYRFEDGMVRTLCGGLREPHLLRPLDYVLDEHTYWQMYAHARLGGWIEPERSEAL